MSITTVKVLRTISKIVLLIVGIGIIGYGGLMVYKSVVNKPQKVRITNVTDSAATITWVTDNPVRGVVYYKDEGSFLPGPLGVLGSKVAYDDRDFALAQDDCVKAFNENAKNTKDEDFAVDGNNFDCENIPVEKLGAYYTHSVTIKDLEDSSTYFFVVGNGIWSWSVDGVSKVIGENDLAVANSFNFKTSQLLDEVPTPNIAYGTVYAGVKSEEGYLSESLSKDSLVFAYLTINGVNSQIISAVTNTDGGWIFDKSNFRDAEGNLITDLSKAKMMVRAQYEDVLEARWVDVVDSLDVDTELDLSGNLVDDLTEGEKKVILDRFESLIDKVYAAPSQQSYHQCPDGDSYDVSGCSTDSRCLKKCLNTNVNENEWVDFGKVGGVCQLPSICGCTPGATENDNVNCKHRTCEAAHYWSSWKPGTAADPECDGQTPSTCNSSTKGSCKDGKRCVIEDGKYTWDTDSSCTTNTSSCNSSTKGTCRDGKRCVIEDGKYTWDRDETCTTDSGAYKCSSPVGNINTCNNGKRCLTVNGDPKWVPDTTCGGGTTESTCTDGTGVGKCNIYGGYCKKAGDKPVADDKCFCDDNGVDRKPGQCVQSVGKECKLNSSGLPSASGSSCSGNSGEQCTVKPTYYTDGNVDGCKTYTLYGCHQICGSVDTNYNTKAKCLAVYPNIKQEYVEGGSECTGNRERSEDQDVNITEIDISSLSKPRLKELLAGYPAFKPLIEKKLEGILDNADVSTCPNTKGGFSGEQRTLAEKLCSALTGEGITVVSKKCDDSDTYKFDFSCPPYVSFIPRIVSSAYAQDSESDGYTLYLPEYGMYSFELGDYELKTDTTGGNTYYIFYIEANDKAGFQAPEDPDNPTADEDIMLKSSSASITYEKVSSAQSYTLVKGINLVSFNFVPVSTDLGPLTAKGVIDEATKKGVTIQYISSFDGGRWAKGYTCKSGKCSGNDFNILPGKGYLVYATKGGEMTIPGYKLKTSVPVNISGGWNLVGIHGYTTAYTARTLIDSMSKIDGVTANNVTWWPTSKGMYEGLQVTGEQQYGFDFPISPTNGYFVRISSFKPEDKKCKSLLWNEGGALNGTCGIIK